MEEPTITAMEYNQCIQTKNQTVRIFSNKTCMVRVFISMPKVNQNRNVRGTLAVLLDDVVHSITSEAHYVSETEPVNINVWRKRSLNHSLNFLVPAGLVVPGKLVVSLTSISTLDGNSTFSWTNHPPTLSSEVHVAPVLRLRLLGAYLNPEIDSQEQAKFTKRFAYSESYLKRLFPVSGIESINAVVDLPANLRSGSNPIKTDLTSGISSHNINSLDAENSEWKRRINAIHIQLMVMRNLDIDAGGDARTHYHCILFSTTESFHGRASDVPTSPDVSVVSSGPSEGKDLDRSGHYTAHELGHALGLLHPGYCHGQAIEDKKIHELYPKGLITNSTENTVGIDVGDKSIGAATTALDTDTTHDIMTYCDEVWINKQNYDNIHHRLAQEEHLVRPHIGQFILIVGEYDMDAHSGSFGGVHRLQRANLSNHSEKGRLALKLTTTTELISIHHIAEKNPLAIGGEFEYGVFNMVIEEPGDPLRSIQLLLDNSPVATVEAPSLHVSTNRNSLLSYEKIEITSIKAHLNGIRLTFAQTGKRKDLYIAVQIKTNQSETWLTIAVFVNVVDSVLVDKQYAKQPECYIRVILSDISGTIVALDQKIETKT